MPRRIRPRAASVKILPITAILPPRACWSPCTPCIARMKKARAGRSFARWARWPCRRPLPRRFRADSDAFSPTVRRGAYVGIDTEFVHPVSGEMYAVLMPHEGLALKRLFFDAARDLFLLRTDHPDHPDGVLSVKECPQRLVGRLVWVLQQI